MGFREKLRKAQGSSVVTLDVKFYFRVQTVDGKTGFTYYDREAEKQKIFVKPIKGIFIGSAMRLSAFSPDLGKKGNRYFTRPYWSLDNITLFEPARGRSRMILSGDMEEVTAFLNVHARGNIQKKKLIYLATEGGLVVVETNMSIAIDQLNRFEKDTFVDYEMILTPALYSETDKNVSEKCKRDVLGSFALKNPPSYANLTKGEKISNELLTALNAESILDQFTAWKEYVLANKQAGAEGSEAQVEHEDVAEAPDHLENKGGQAGVELLNAEPEDDLPF